MENRDWQTATRYRLGVPAAALVDPESMPKECCHKGPHGALCRHALDGDNQHAVHCGLGGGTVRRHNAVARTVADILRDVAGLSCRFEQHVPRLDDVHNGQPRKAIMDIVFQAPDGSTQLIDVSLVSACAGPATRMLASARRDGVAADEACKLKHRRYGKGRVVPFVLELGGRPSAEARQWLRKALAWASPDADAPPVRGANAWARISCTMQRYVAAQLRAAVGA